jgi:hypothetical protein
VSRQVRLYRHLVGLYPAGFQHDYADEMVRLFADQLRDAQASHRTLAVPGLWARSVVDLVVTAPRQHLREARAVPQTVEQGVVTAGADTRPSRPLPTTLAAGPALAWAVLSLAAPQLTEPFYFNPPSLFGLPFGIVVIGVVVILTLSGLLLVRKAKSQRGVLVGLTFFTLPATILIFYTPPLIIFMMNSHV